MSIALAPVNLASVVLGQSGVVQFQTAGPDANPARIDNPAHIMIHNESGVGLVITFTTSNSSFHLPAGGWIPIALDPGESTLKWTVEYILNVVGGAPVSQLLITYYQPFETIPSTPLLGNSPIGGAVSTTSIQTLSNEGNPANQLVIDIGDAAFAQLYTLFTDGHSVWAVDQSGVKHQAIKVQASGNPLQLGQTGDTVEVLGGLLIDQTLIVTSTITSNGTLKVNTIADNVTGANQITLTTAGISILNAVQAALSLASTLTVTGEGDFNAALPSVVTAHGINNTGLGDTYVLATNGATVINIDAANKNLKINSPNIGGAGSLALQVGGVSGLTMDATQTCSLIHSLNLVVGSIGQLSTFNGTGNGTVATGVTNPTAIAFDDCTLSGSSQTLGGTVASSSVVTTGSGLAWRGTAWHN